MNIDMNQSIRPGDIEYMTTYPAYGGHPEEKTLILIARDKEYGKVLLYAPKVIHRDLTTEEESCVAEYRSHRDIITGRIVMDRKLAINNEMYILPSGDKSTFFSIIPLDKQSKPTVKKEEVEKLFGCQIDG